MFQKPLDIVTIGDVTTDAFIRLKDASLHCKVSNEDCELCFRFGDKVPFEYVKVVRAVGNAANAAVTAARLGLRAGLVSNIGDDTNGRECMAELQKNKVITTYTKVHTGRPTNYHFVLWYDVDRTILVNHVNYDYSLPKFPAPKWIYLTSVASNSLDYQFSVIDYIEQNPKVRLAFQPGTYQLKLGPEKLSRIYKATDVLVVNLEEARRITSTHTGSTSAPAPEVRSQEHIQYIKNLLNSIGKLGPKLTIITDSHNGAYMHDGDLFYHMPIYPDPRPPFERTGCGDAFTATFVSALALGLSPVEALMWAPVNPMSVAQFVGSQEGLLKREQLEWWLERAPEDYKPRGI